MNKRLKGKKRKNIDLKSRTIKRQVDEINSLKQIISKLEIDCEKKGDIINSIDSIRNDMLETFEEVKNKGDEYDKLIAELKHMQKAINQIVFKNKWKLIRLLVK